jgi:hypothetical protein
MNDPLLPQPPEASPSGDDNYVAVRKTVDLFLVPGRPHGLTDSVEWHCSTCRTGGDASDIHSAATGLTTHLCRHHHAGPGALS